MHEAMVKAPLSLLSFLLRYPFSPFSFQSSQIQAGIEHEKAKKRTANMIPFMIANNNGLKYESLGIAFSSII
jgi:hypothetical protein